MKNEHCEIHKKKLLIREEDYSCGDPECCGLSEPDYYCPKCKEEEKKAWDKKQAKECNLCLYVESNIGGLIVKNRKIIKIPHDAKYIYFTHGGKKLRKMTWAKLNPKTGYIEKAPKGWKTDILVIK